jgi:chemotaxis protein methyltransferase CheR
VNDQEYNYLKERILRLTGIDLEDYKSQQMRRRLEGFISRAPETEVVLFCKLLDKDPAVLKKLKDFLTINVSEFFRDSAQFDVLKNRIVPELLRHSPNLSIWSAGCSMGAEPYSMAILLDQISPKGSHRIMATDLDEKVLVRARAGGPYSPADVKNVSRALLLKYFTPFEEGHRINDDIRRRVEFRQHNLLKDAFPVGFDLVICRNVVIYFTEEAKDKLYRGFWTALKPEGLFFIGGTETLLDANNLGFNRICTSFYGKTPPAARATAQERRSRPAA